MGPVERDDMVEHLAASTWVQRRLLQEVEDFMAELSIMIEQHVTIVAEKRQSRLLQNPFGSRMRCS